MNFRCYFFKENTKIFLYILFAMFVKSNLNGQLLPDEIDGKVIKNDSISIYIDQSKSDSIMPELRLNLLLKALKYTKKIKVDSTKSKAYSKLSFAFYRQGNTKYFLEINRTAIELATHIQDSVALAEAYWDLGSYYSKISTVDSAYYGFSKAQSIYEAINNDYRSSQMLNFMAGQQESVKDYTGSEANIILAIKFLKPLKRNKSLYESYNRLGIVAKGLGEYDRAINYYKEALIYSNKLKHNEHYLPRMTNNIGVVYKNKNDFSNALKNFERVLVADSIKFINPKLYATALNNLAFSKIKINDTLGTKAIIDESMHIKDSLGLYTSLTTSYITLAEYYLFKKDTVASILATNKAKTIAKETKNNMRLLETLAFLNKIDHKNASLHGQAYIELSERLETEERRARNKFARIRFETDEFIAENEVLSEEKNLLFEEKELLSKQNQIWAALAAGFFLFGLAIYIIVDQRSKNQKLKFQQQQQFSNQEIFNLMLSQKQKVDEVKRMEQKRISEELHDGVLGKMLGARMVLTGLNKKANEDAIKERSEAIAALKNIENELRSISHELSHTAYQKLNNFVSSVELLLTSATGKTEISAILNHNEDEDWDSLIADIKINVYRIIQESIQNAIKHSGCSNFFVNFEIKDNLFLVTIRDNGKGFTFDKERKGIGIRNIRSRVSKMNGSWDVNTVLGNGTVMTIKIPIEYGTNTNDSNTNTF